MGTQKKTLTVEQFRVEYLDQPYELIRGRVVKTAPADFAHSVVTSRVVALLYAGVAARRTGGVVTVDAGFVLAPDTLCNADCAFIAQDRLTLLGDPDTVVPFAPDLVVEVASSHDVATIVRDKIAQYRAAGTRLIWVIYPDLRTVDVYWPDGSVHVLEDHDLLDGGAVLPGVEIAVAELFPSL